MSDLSGEPLFVELVRIFGQAGLLYGFIWLLLKALKEQYDERIKAHERRIESAEAKIAECEADRHDIRNTLDRVREEQLREIRQMHGPTVRMVKYHGLDNETGPICGGPKDGR